MKVPSVLAGVMLCSAMLLADTQHIDFDQNTDFSRIRTFAIRAGRIESQKPELNNRLFIQKMEFAIRAELTAKGLKETADRPDVFVEFRLAAMDYSNVERQQGTRVPDGPGGMRGYVIDGTGPRTVLSSEGTLVIDMTMGQPGVLVWRGTYRDEERSGPKLARKLPGDATRLLSEFPPRTKA
jgi:hypothetical protein